MAFPTLVPSSRAFTPGRFPQKVFKSQSGSETRILYGDKETDATLSLSYKNLEDGSADNFILHYRQMKGSYTTLDLSGESYDDTLRGGWKGIGDRIKAPSGTLWRYEGQPRVTSVKPGISNVTVKLIAGL